MPANFSTPPSSHTALTVSQPHDAVLAMWGRTLVDVKEVSSCVWAKEWKEDGLTAAHTPSAAAGTLCVPQKHTQALTSCCRFGIWSQTLIYLTNHFIQYRDLSSSISKSFFAAGLPATTPSCPSADGRSRHGPPALPGGPCPYCLFLSRTM